MRRVLLPHRIDEAPPPDGAVRDYGGTAMGTRWSARLVQARAAADLGDGLQRQLDAVVAEMSHWLPDSDLGRFNRAPAGTWQVLPPAFFHVLAYALDVRAASGGTCDPCAGALVNLWGFGPTGRYDEPGFAPPSADAIRALLPLPRVKLDPVSRAAWQPGGVQLDLSAVAKGYGVDCLARWLEEQGVRDYVVEVGGELRGAGMKPDGQPWWVALEPVPDASDDDGIVLALHGLAVATSGDYRKYFHDGATRRAHTIDPRTGWPVAHALASVTVVDASCMACDAWSTALTVLGPHEGLALAERRGIAARFVVRDGAAVRERMTSHLRAMMAA